MQGFKRWIGREIGVWVAIWHNVNLMFDAVMLQFLSEMMRRAKHVIGIVSMVYHHGPHSGLGDGVGEVVVFSDFNRVGKIPGMKPIQGRANESAEPEGHHAGHAHVFAAMHNLEGGDVKLFTKT